MPDTVSEVEASNVKKPFPPMKTTRSRALEEGLSAYGDYHLLSLICIGTELHGKLVLLFSLYSFREFKV